MNSKIFSLKIKNYRYFCLLFLLGILPSLNLSAQNNSINLTGEVIDKTTKEPIVAATIRIKDTAKGVVTDIDGKFQIEAPANGVLIVSLISYKTQEIPIQNKKELTILMDEDLEMLDEVVVIGYGQVRKGDATGSLTSIKPDDRNKGLQVTAQDALIGKIAGVNIVPGSGAPGSGGTIRIRMGASLNAKNDPLIVIDGVPVENTSISAINPNDIETFTVLKDASATAIYGSRASNGVIIITTKKGVSGSTTPRISYSSNFTISKQPDLYDVLTADEYRKAFAGNAIGVPTGFQLGTANTNWQKEIYRTAFGTDHNLSLTGSLKGMPFRISGGYLNQDGILKANNYERYNIALGISPKFFNQHLSVDMNIKYSVENEKPASTGAIGGAISFDPTRPIHQTYNKKMGLGYYMWLDSDGTPIPLSPTNPLSELELTQKKNTTKRSIGNIALDYKIHGFEDLRLNLNLGYDIRQKDYQEIIQDFAPSMYTSNRNDGTGKVYRSENKNKNYIFTSYLNYTKDITQKHNINAMAGYEWQRFWYDKLDETIIGYPSSSPDKGALYLLSFFGRANYSFDRKLLLTATLRADGSSRFAKGNQWGYFPSMAVGYRLTEEPFLKNIKPLSDLKVRFSYGQTGQQDIGAYHPYLASYTISQDEARYLFGSDWINMYRPNGFDRNIKWETTSTYNIGVDYGFLSNRIYGSIDAFKRYTKDLLNYIAIPAGSNFTNFIETNIGDMEGKGIEVALTAIPFKNKDWEWTISGNFTYSESKIKKLNAIDTNDSYLKTGGVSRNELQIHKVGERPNTFFLLHQAYDDNGKPLDGKYIGKNGQITSSTADAEKYITGKSSRTPYYYGFSTRLMYKEWDFGINGHGSFGNYIFNYQEAKQSLMGLYGNGISSNISKTALERGFTQERYFSDYFLESGAFFKIDNITAGYTFHKLWNTSSSLRLAFSVQNIATITKYSGVDPEIFNGIDNNTYQRPQIYTLSLNLNF